MREKVKLPEGYFITYEGEFQAQRDATRRIVIFSAVVAVIIVFLLYACYQPLRFSIEDPERQARTAAVFSVVAGAFVPLNFLAVRMAESFTHPRVLSATGGSMPGEMRLTFLVSLLGMAVLFITLCKYELTSKQASMQLRQWVQRF